MTIDQLVVLQQIVENGSFRAAAESLHRAQSAVSYAIKTLEEELGFSLFNREGYRPVLTVEGEAIYRKAKTILAEVEDLECLGEQLSMGREPEVSLAVNAICPMPPVISVLQSFAKNNPYTQLRLSFENLWGAMERLLDGEADIILTESFEWQERLESRPCSQISFTAVAAPSCALMQVPQPIPRSELTNHTQIVVRDTSRHSQKKTVGVLENSVVWTVSDFSIKRELLLAGLGWGLMPTQLVEQELKTKQLCGLVLEEPLVGKVDLFMVRRRDRPIGPMAGQLWESLHQSFDR